MRNFYDYIETLQQKQFSENIEKVLQIMQLNLFGNIDSGFSIKWNPLGKEDESIKATTEKTKVDTICALADRGIISQEEARKVLAEDKEGAFSGIDPNEAVEAEEDLFSEIDKGTLSG